ncbi:toll/interleukin-1 receptor domain-containing protein [Streptomyces sp. PA03-6a]|nr:toll/interleukin-1 receptor domain-containing protein [Streptomyces sp. PA03-6a]
MAGVELAIGVVGLIIAVVSAYFGYVGVRGRIRRRRGGEGGRLVAAEGGDAYEVFVSYAAPDVEEAERLAGCLQGAGIRVFLVRWVEPGLVSYLESERALAGATFGVLLFSDATMADLRIRDEYAALLQRVHGGGFRFVPARTGDVALPQFAAIREPLDLSEPGGPRYDADVSRLVGIVRRQRSRTGA